MIIAGIRDPKKAVVSIAAETSLLFLQEMMPQSSIVRVPSLVSEMAAGVVYADNVSDDGKLFITALLGSAGTVIEVSEDKMDAVTALSGSGPVFVARLIEAFLNAAVLEGFDYGEAYKLSVATFIGTSKLLKEKEMALEDLITMVSSPKGTTVAGREVLEASNYQTIINETIAANRSIELG